MSTPAARFEAAELCRFIRDVLLHYGAQPGPARNAAACLADADLAGIDTHGIANFVSHCHYAPGLEGGSVNPDPVVGVQHRGNTEVLTADRGFGPMVARAAMEHAIALARGSGVGTVVVRDGCHFGAAGYFASLAAQQGMIGPVMCPTGPSTIAPGGLDKSSAAIRLRWRRRPAGIILSCSTWPRLPRPEPISSAPAGPAARSRLAGPSMPPAS